MDSNFTSSSISPCRNPLTVFCYSAVHRGLGGLNYECIFLHFLKTILFLLKGEGVKPSADDS